MQRKLGRNYLNLCFTKIKKPIPTRSSPPFFIKSYNSLYVDISTGDDSASPSSSFSGDPEAHFAAAFTSHRFFFSSPGRSNSIIESTITTGESSPSPSSSGPGADLLFTTAIPTYSPDPYADFRRSMQEMVEAREQMDVKKSSLEFLQELLLCYLALNPKSTHEYILGAFADLAGVMKPAAAVAEDGRRGNDGD